MATLYDVLMRRVMEIERQGAGSLAPPAAILWTDRHQEWSNQVAVLSARRAVLTLGELQTEQRTGPALWIRCMLARTLPSDKLPPDTVPVVYLPGVGREDLRAVEDCPESLKPLAELQYRSVFFSHPNGKDWSVSAWLGHKTRGAGVDIATDSDSRAALVTAQSVLFEQEVESFRGRVLRASDLLDLLVPDEVAELLRWIEDETTFKVSKATELWEAFVAEMKSHFGLDVEGDGVLIAAEKLAERQGEWAKAWSRFTDAPRRYAGIPAVLRRAAPSTLMPAYQDSWPQINDDAEKALRLALTAIRQMPINKARDHVAVLEHDHGWRRGSVWHELGETPLADALEHLARLTDLSEQAMGGASPQTMAQIYADGGWKTDDAYLRALGSVEKANDISAVQSCAAAVYQPWADQSARALQEVVGVGWPSVQALAVDAGTSVLFCDGLRFDLAQRLAAMLQGVGVQCEVGHGLAALPSLTATGKPAATSVADMLGPGPELTPQVKGNGKPATADVLRSLMSTAGFQILGASDWGDPSGRAWAEMGDIDTLGHKVEAKLVGQLESELRLVADRVHELFATGWAKVVIVTDHGWLLMPEKLPKVELAKCVVEPRKGRCGRLESQADVPPGAVVAPWSWDPSVRVVFAPGISTYVDGKQFDHGGLSLQECVIPRITCSMAAGTTVKQVAFGDERWINMRIRVTLTGGHAGCSLDLRRKAADPATTYVAGPRPIDDEGVGSLLVPDDAALGDAAVLVVLDSDGTVLVQRTTVIGGD